MKHPKQADYQRKYDQKRTMRHVSFNTETEADLLALSRELDFSVWVKGKLREELARRAGG